MTPDLHSLVDTMAALAMLLFVAVGGVSALSVEQDVTPPDADGGCWPHRADPFRPYRLAAATEPFTVTFP